MTLNRDGSGQVDMHIWMNSSLVNSMTQMAPEGQAGPFTEEEIRKEYEGASGIKRKIELTCVDPDATGYGTFQSHNQKVVSNRNGIFMTHVRSRNDAYTAQQWRLSRSTDGGATFETI